MAGHLCAGVVYQPSNGAGTGPNWGTLALAVDPKTARPITFSFCIFVFFPNSSGINGIRFIDVSVGRNGAFAGVGLFHISNCAHALG